MEKINNINNDELNEQENLEKLKSLINYDKLNENLQKYKKERFTKYIYIAIQIAIIMLTLYTKSTMIKNGNFNQMSNIIYNAFLTISTFSLGMIFKFIFTLNLKISIGEEMFQKRKEA